MAVLARPQACWLRVQPWAACAHSQPAALPAQLTHGCVLSHSQDPDKPLSKELCAVGSQPACDFPVTRVQQRLPLVLADARKTFCNPGKFPVLTLHLTAKSILLQWHLQAEKHQIEWATVSSLRRNKGRERRRKKQFSARISWHYFSFKVLKPQLLVLKTIQLSSHAVDLKIRYSWASFPFVFWSFTFRRWHSPAFLCSLSMARNFLFIVVEAEILV